MRNFKESEFVDGWKYAHPAILTGIDDLRDILGAEIYPSPVPGGLARFDIGKKGSEHYAVGRLSTAIDFFVNMDPFEAYCRILKSGTFNRLGIYFDTFYKNRKWVMFHGDLKNEELMWLRQDKKYIYSTEARFFNILFKNFFLNREN